EVQSLVRRLQRMDVEVRVLDEEVTVEDYTPYGRPSERTTLPEGTYWIPMAQAQKHWVQAMLNEDTYTPFPYFYDVTAWSQPLLFNVDGGRSGAELDPAWEPAPVLAEPEVALPADRPSVGVWQMSTSTTAVESSGWLRWLFEKKWGLGYRDLTTKDIKSGELGGVDVLVVPDGSASAGEKELGGAGVRAVRDWVAAGGRFVGLSGGAGFAGRAGLTTATLSSPSSEIPGSLVRAGVDTDSPLAAGVGDEVYSFVEYDPVLEASDPATVAVRYPDAAPDFFVSGYAEGEEELQGTAAVTDEAYRDGRVVLFASDPNFRAFTDGTQKLLWNALLGPDPAAPAAGTARQRSAAVAAAAEVPDLGGALLVTVRPGAVGRAERLLSTYGLDSTRTTVSGGTRLTVAGFGTADRNPVTKDLVRGLHRLGDAVEAVRLP
ncbi:MAG TPA: hypothetical protein VFN19_05505, partial [Candidatus Nanopelagicales bacterium]|nr:hypothetical protein [Candidatus Nanopelagicales bacterium]